MSLWTICPMCNVTPCCIFPSTLSLHAWATQRWFPDTGLTWMVLRFERFSLCILHHTQQWCHRDLEHLCTGGGSKELKLSRVGLQLLFVYKRWKISKKHQRKCEWFWGFLKPRAKIHMESLQPLWYQYKCHISLWVVVMFTNPLQVGVDWIDVREPCPCVVHKVSSFTIHCVHLHVLFYSHSLHRGSIPCLCNFRASHLSVFNNINRS